MSTARSEYDPAVLQYPYPISPAESHRTVQVSGVATIRVKKRGMSSRISLPRLIHRKLCNLRTCLSSELISEHPSTASDHFFPNRG